MDRQRRAQQHHVGQAIRSSPASRRDLKSSQRGYADNLESRLGKLNFPATTIKFEPLPVKAGAEWQVVVTYPTGETEHVGGFGSETEALDWIGSTACFEWVKERGYS